MANGDWERLERLFIQYQNHDESAVTELFLGLQVCVRTFLLSKGLVREEAEELTQDVLLKVHLKRERYSSKLPLKPWITTIAHRVLIDHWRAHKNYKFDLLEKVEKSNFDPAQFDSEPLNRMVFKDLIRKFSVLKPLDLAILQAAAIEGKSHGQIANEYNMTRGSVKVRLHRIRVFLNGLIIMLVFTWVRGG